MKLPRNHARRRWVLLAPALALAAGAPLGAWSTEAQPVAEPQSVAEPQPVARPQPVAEARRLLAAGQAAAAVRPLVEAFAADRDASAAREVLWALARGAAPRPEVVEAVVRAADRLGPDGWIAAGVLLRRGLRPLDALAAFDRGAARRPPGDPLADVEAGRLLAELRADERALDRFRRHPDDPGATYARAVILARKQRLADAATLTDALLRRDPENPAALLLQAELLDSVGRGSEALPALRRLAGAAGSTGPAALRLARVLVKLGRADEALPVLEGLVAATPENAEAWFALARTHRDGGRTAEAVAAFRRALALDAALNEARFGLARLLARTGEREAAEPLFAEFERRAAVEAEAAQRLGEAELRPDDFTAVAAFVDHALTQGDLGLALRAAQRFLVEFPDAPERHLLLARVFREGGSRAEAERVLRRGLARFAGDETAVRRFEAGLRAIGAE